MTWNRTWGRWEWEDGEQALEIDRNGGGLLGRPRTILKRLWMNEWILISSWTLICSKFSLISVFHQFVCYTELEPPFRQTSDFQQMEILCTVHWIKTFSKLKSYSLSKLYGSKFTVAIKIQYNWTIYYYNVTFSLVILLLLCSCVTEQYLEMRFQILTTSSMKLTVFWDVLCSLVESDRHFRGAALKCQAVFTILCGVASQKTVTITFLNVLSVWYLNVSCTYPISHINVELTVISFFRNRFLVSSQLIIFLIAQHIFFY
jgi:hypothetical protein